MKRDTYRADEFRKIQTGTQLSLDGDSLDHGSIDSFEVLGGDPYNINSTSLSKRKNKRFNPDVVSGN